MARSCCLTAIGRLATLDVAPHGVDVRPAAARDTAAAEALGVLNDAALVIEGENVVWIGAAADAPAADEVVDCGSQLVVPGFVDCHTHLVFGGDRSGEFVRRTQGESYEQIAAAGGGILSTVRATRAATDAELVDSARRRLDEMLALGVTTIEAKSGYGLDTATELRILRLLREIDRQHPISIVSTFLGAHSIPAEHRGDRQGYLELLMDEMLPAVAAEGLATFCDVFCEKGVFRPDETRAVLTRARELGLGAKIHAEQLHNSGGVDVGIELGAVSVDHLEQIDERQIRALAASQTIAVLLPAATLFLGSHHFAPGRALLDAGVRVALATDSNPGSAMTTHLPLMTTLAAVYMGLRPDEALRAITRDAAAAIGLDERAGRIAVGRPADLVVTNLQHENQLPYRMASNPAAQVFKRGALVAAAGRRVDFSVT